MILDELIWLFV